MIALVNMFANSGEGEWESTCELEASLEVSVAAVIPHPISWSQVCDAVANDPTMSMLAEQISSGFPPDKKLLRVELKEFFNTVMYFRK